MFNHAGVQVDAVNVNLNTITGILNNSNLMNIGDLIRSSYKGCRC